MEPGVTTSQLDLELAERFQRLRGELEFTSFGLNFMHLAPGQRGRIHRHERQEEVYVVLEGALSVQVEGGETFEISRGGLARVAPDLRRQLSNRGAEPVRFLAVGGGSAHESRDAVAYEDWDSKEGRTPQDVPLPEDLPTG
jgi:mannose-6-phosphate isomerase-like protein (cupin superfamily)